MMSRKRSNPNRELEVLNSQINVSGEGEDPVVQALMSEKFTNGTDREAGEIALALQQLLRGQTSLLANQQAQSDELARQRERWAKYDEQAAKFDADKQKFLDEVDQRANKLRLTGSKKEELEARESKRFQSEVKKARVKAVSDNLKAEELMAREPKVTVTLPGKIEMVMENGQIIPRVFAQTVTIRHHTWTFQPGVPQDVPESVAMAIAQRLHVQQEGQERADVYKVDMDGGLSNRHRETAQAQKWAELNQKYQGGNREAPVPPVR
jgi:hypothetical protein